MSISRPQTLVLALSISSLFLVACNPDQGNDADTDSIEENCTTASSSNYVNDAQTIVHRVYQRNGTQPLGIFLGFTMSIKSFSADDIQGGKIIYPDDTVETYTPSFIEENQETYLNFQANFSHKNVSDEQKVPTGPYCLSVTKTDGEQFSYSVTLEQDNGLQAEEQSSYWAHGLTVDSTDTAYLTLPLAQLSNLVVDDVEQTISFDMVVDDNRTTQFDVYFQNPTYIGYYTEENPANIRTDGLSKTYIIDWDSITPFNGVTDSIGSTTIIWVSLRDTPNSQSGYLSFVPELLSRSNFLKIAP